jgi:hypothetical protein
MSKYKHSFGGVRNHNIVNGMPLSKMGRQTMLKHKFKYRARQILCKRLKYRLIFVGQRVVTNSANCSRLMDYEGNEGVPGNSPRISWSALRVYCHILHNQTYVSRNVRTESPAKIKRSWNDLQIPRYLRDVFREICRPMSVDNVTVVPFFQLDRVGAGPAIGFGIMPTKFQGVVNALKLVVSGTPWDDWVPLELESPKQAPFFIATDSSIMTFTGVHESWRLEAITTLRHVNRRCQFFDSWPRPPRAPQVHDERFVARSLVRDAFVAEPLPNPRGDGPHGDVYLQDNLVDRRSLERHLGLRLTQAPGAVPPLPPTVLGRGGLLVMYFTTEVTQQVFDRLLVGVDRFVFPGIPPAFAVTVHYFNVHITTAQQPRFPSREDHSQTPPQSPMAEKSKGVHPKKGKKGRPNKKQPPKKESVVVPSPPDPAVSPQA